MALSKPTVGDPLWGSPLNAALDSLDTTKATLSDLAALTARVDSLQSTILSMSTPQFRTYAYEEAGANLQPLGPGNDILSVTGNVAYSTAATFHQTYGLRRTTLTLGNYVYPNISVIGSQGSVYVRATNVVAGVPQSLFTFETSAGVSAGSLVLRSGGQVALLDPDGLAQSITVAQFTVGTWFRVDWQQTWDGQNQKITARLSVSPESSIYSDQISVQFASPIPELIHFLKGAAGNAWGIDIDTYRTNNVLTTWYGPVNASVSALSTYLFDAGPAGSAPSVGTAGVTAVSGTPTLSAAASKHTTTGATYGINVPATSGGGTISYAISSSTVGTGSLYINRIAKGAAASKGITFKNGTNILGMIRLSTGGNLSIADSASVNKITTTQKVALSAWARIDWQRVYNSAAQTLALTVRYFISDSEGSTPDETITFTLTGVTLAPTTVMIGSDSADWNLYLDTLRLWDNIDAWPAPYGTGGGAGSPVHQYSLLGDATPTGVVVKSMVSGVTAANLLVSTSSNMTSPTLVGSQTASVDKIIEHTVTGLTQNTQYYMMLADSTGTTTFGDLMKVRTAPDGTTSFTRKIGLMSCQQNAAGESLYTQGTTQAGWLHMLNWQPDELLHGGDFGYWGGGFALNPLDPYSAHIAKYTNQIAALPVMRSVLLNTTSLIQVSDHETSGNNGDNYNDPITGVALTAYQKLMPVRAYADTRVPKRGRYFSRNIGPRIRLISIDFRSMDRSPGNLQDGSAKSALGSTQLSWLFSELVRPETLKIIVSDPAWGPADPPVYTNPPTYYDSKSKTYTNIPISVWDKWHNYQNEQTVISNFIASNLTTTGNPINVDFWGNDRHYISWLPGTNPGGGAPYNSIGGFDVLCGSGISQHSLSLLAGEKVAQVYGNTENSPYGFGLNGTVIQYMQITLSDTGAGVIQRIASGVGTYLNHVANTSPAVDIAPAQSDIIQRVSNTKTWNY